MCVDEFNLYYGALKRALDLGRLCSAMLPSDNILAINYNTARVPLLALRVDRLRQ